MKTVVCPRFSVTGVLPPVTENPEPLMFREVMVAAAVPVEVTVMDLVTAFPTRTSPNASEEALRLNDGAEVFDALSWNATVFDDSFAVADKFIVCAALTAATFAVNDAVVDFAGIVTFAGAFTALPLEARATVKGVEEDAVAETVQVVFPEPVNEVLAQDSALSSAAEVAFDGGVRASENVFTIVPCVAVMMPAWLSLTDVMAAVNLAVVSPASTVTDAGTLIAARLLDNCTTDPPEGAALLIVTVHASEAAPAAPASAQLNPLSSAVWAEVEPLP